MDKKIFVYIIAKDPILKNHLENLSDEEKIHLTTLTSQQGKQNFVLGHSLLRQHLSLNSDTLPKDIPLTVTDTKKPILTPGHNPHNLHFNISHCPGAILIGVNKNHPIGVDIETLTRKTTHKKVAEKHFTAEELSYCKANGSLSDFLRLWTLKEAYAKSLGKGIYASFKTFSVQLDSFLNPSIKNSETTTLKSIVYDRFVLGIAVQQPNAAFLDPTYFILDQ